MRAFATAIASSMVLATEDKKYADFVCTAEFGNLHPYNPECWAKFEHLLRTGRCRGVAGWSKLWDRAAKLWISEGARISDYPVEQLGLFNALMAVSGAPVLIFREAYRGKWLRLWKRAGNTGAVDQPYIRGCLSLLGAHTGEFAALLEWLLADNHRSLEVADLLLFVRTDRSSDLTELFARVVRNETGHPSDYLLPGNPTATLNALFQYIRTTMRRPGNFCNVGLVLATLQWAVAGIDLANDSVREGVITERYRAVLLRSLATTEEVQRMEKNRFWNIVEQLPLGPLRNRIEDLWSRISVHQFVVPPG